MDVEEKGETRSDLFSKEEGKRRKWGNVGVIVGFVSRVRTGIAARVGSGTEDKMA
jgi:hypothetical protein